ncbi:hypothetical protein Agub_g11091, partial [Astrephomene gubernaculifera]
VTAYSTGAAETHSKMDGPSQQLPALPPAGERSLYDVLAALPSFWALLGRQSSLTLRAVSREARNLHDAACLSLHVNAVRAIQLFQSQLSGCIAGLESLAAISRRGCKPLKLTLSCGNALSEAVLCGILREVACTATTLALLGSPRLSDRIACSLPSLAPQLQHLLLELPDASATKGSERVLAAVGPQLTSLELRMGPRGAPPVVALEGCTALQELRLQLDMQTSASLGPLRMRGDEVPPAVASIASLNRLRCLELYGSALERILDPPYRLAGLSALTGLTRLRADLHAGFLTTHGSQEGAAAAAGGAGAAGRSDKDEESAHAAFWRQQQHQPGLQSLLLPPSASSSASSAVESAAAAAAAAACMRGGPWSTAERRWQLLPLASSVRNLVELNLGRSYELTVYDMAAVLSKAVQLTCLTCRSIVLPPVPPAVWGTGTSAAAVGAVGAAVAAGSSRGGGGGGCGSLAAPVVLFPPHLRELQVRHLPAAPILASLGALTGFTVLTCRQLTKAAAAAAAMAAPAAATASAAAASGGNGNTATPLGEPGPTAATETAAVNTACAPLHAGEASHSSAPPAITEGTTAAATPLAAVPAAWGRLALVGSSCEAESLDTDPWVTDVLLAACRLLARTLQPYNRHQPSGAVALAPASKSPPLLLPAGLVIRPFERGRCMLAGTGAGGWLASLAPLRPMGLSALQLRGFAFGPGELQLLQVALPELREVELRGCTAPDEDVLELRRWLLG